MPKLTPETKLKREIKRLLKSLGIFHFHNLQGLGAYKGIPDIMGSYKGRWFVIEVKSPKGRVSEHQKTFLEQVKSEGHIIIVAYGIDDVINGLGLQNRFVN